MKKLNSTFMLFMTRRDSWKCSMYSCVVELLRLETLGPMSWFSDNHANQHANKFTGTCIQKQGECTFCKRNFISTRYRSLHIPSRFSVFCNAKKMNQFMGNLVVGISSYSTQSNSTGREIDLSTTGNSTNGIITGGNSTVGTLRKYPQRNILRKWIKKYHYDIYHNVWRSILEQFLADRYNFDYNTIDFSEMRQSLRRLHNWNSETRFVARSRDNISKVIPCEVSDLEKQFCTDSILDIGSVEIAKRNSSFCEPRSKSSTHFPSYFLQMNLLKELSRQICDQYNMIHPFDKRNDLLREFNSLLKQSNAYNNISSSGPVFSRSITLPASLLSELALKYKLSKVKIRHLFYSWRDTQFCKTYNDTELHEIKMKAVEFLCHHFVEQNRTDRFVSKKQTLNNLFKPHSSLGKWLKETFQMCALQQKLILRRISRHITLQPRLTQTKKNIVIAYVKAHSDEGDFTLNPFHMQKLKSLSELSESQIRGIVRLHMEKLKHPLTNQAKLHVTSYLEEHQYQKLSKEQFDILANQLPDCGHYQLRFLIKNLIYSHRSKSEKSNRNLHQVETQEIMEWIKRCTSSNQYVPFEIKNSIVSRFNISMDEAESLYRKVVDPPGIITKEKKKKIIEWFNGGSDQNLLDEASLQSIKANTKLSSQQIRDVIRNARAKDVERRHSLVVKEWVKQNFDSYPSEVQFRIWMNDTGLTREQLRKLVYYWKNPPQPFTQEKKEKLKAWLQDKIMSLKTENLRESFNENAPRFHTRSIEIDGAIDSKSNMKNSEAKITIIENKKNVLNSLSTEEVKKLATSIGLSVAQTRAQLRYLHKKDM